MEELLEIDNTTGEILLPNVDEQSVQKIKQTKIKALQLLTPNDFVLINGTWEAKRDGLIKILSSLPISYAWEIKDKQLTDTYALITGVLTITTADVTRVCDSVGTCELDELKGSKTRHIMIATSETRALKRAIETLFGSVINFYVVKYLVN
jgi:hypothetical protein